MTNTSVKNARCNVVAQRTTRTSVSLGYFSGWTLSVDFVDDVEFCKPKETLSLAATKDLAAKRNVLGVSSPDSARVSACRAPGDGPAPVQTVREKGAQCARRCGGKRDAF